MAVIKGKKVSRPTRQGEVGSRAFIPIRPLFVLLCAAVLYYASSNWQSWLEKLDTKPISSFALLGTPQFTTNADVREVILSMGELKGFFAQDLDVVREQIQSMSWIKGAVVRKVWPDKLSVSVAEYSPVAIWNGDSFLSAEGAIFQLPSNKLKTGNFPRLFGPDYQSAVVFATWNQLYKELQAKGMVLRSVAIDERGSWEIVLDNEITLKLGRGEWKSKIDRFVTIYPQIEIPEHKKIDYVDLRYKVGTAVGFIDN